MSELKNAEVAVRSHDVVVTSAGSRAAEFDSLTTLGAAVRLALHLRGIPPVSYELLRKVAVHRLGLQPSEVRPALDLLAEAEMVEMVTEARTVKTVLPDIPYFRDLYTDLGQLSADTAPLNEHEQLTIAVMEALARGPRRVDDLHSIGAEKVALSRVLEIGSSAGFVVSQRARGQDILISPSYFSEDAQALADLMVVSGGTRLSSMLELLRQHQGFPLKTILEHGEIGGRRLDPRDRAVLKALAGEGFIPPPAIRTSHSGENHFLFGPRPGGSRLLPYEIPIYNHALALVAAVRQGQFLAKEYAIRHPRLLLEAFRERGFLRSNTEANEQYRSLVQLGVAKLVRVSGGWSKLELIDNPDNRRTVQMALDMVHGGEPQPRADEELILALRRGEEYVEPLLARKALADYRLIEADRESKEAIDAFFLRGVA